MPLLKQPSEAELERALAGFPILRRPQARPLAGGLINRTFAVEDPAGAFILQLVNPIFNPAIHETIALATSRLERRGLITPKLLPTRAGALYLDLAERGVWRLMTRVPGTSFDVVQDPAQARSAGALVARFHSALDGLEHSFRGVRLGVHDTPAHLATLARALEQHRGHPLRVEVEPLARAIQAAFAALPSFPDTPSRVVHGDLKFSNILFKEGAAPAEGEAICLIDLDTIAPMPLHHELGDAWRSWCNAGGEDGSPRFDLEIFAASLAGYASALERPLQASERRALVHGVEWISLELSARFAADALNESYFLWDRARFQRAGEHNLLRARGQWSLFQSALASRDERAALLRVRV